MRGLRYDVNSVASIYDIDPDEIFRKGRQKPRVDARGLCYWVSRELKISLADLARKLDMTISVGGCVVQRGKSIALKTIFNCLIKLFSVHP